MFAPALNNRSKEVYSRSFDFPKVMSSSRLGDKGTRTYFIIFADREFSGEDATAAHGLWPTLAWSAFLLCLSSLVGSILALAVFLLGFLRLRASQALVNAAIYAVFGIGFLCFMVWTLNRNFSPELLQSYFELPWPFK
jgi:putative tricarboxylic transport membrane protein